MEFTLFVSNKSSAKPLVRQLSWYDTKNKKMLHFSGGDLEFVYDDKEKRSLPKVVDRTEKSNTSNYDAVKSWIDHNSDRFDIQVIKHSPKSITIEAPDGYQDDIEQDLHKEKIHFDA